MATRLKEEVRSVIRFSHARHVLQLRFIVN